MTGMTKGAVFLDKGEIVDASLGKLSGFQAINAISSIPQADFQFDASIAPQVQRSITPNERILLNDFFGIGEVHQPHYFDGVNGPEDYAPEQVVPLSEVEDEANTNLVDEQPATEIQPHFGNADLSDEDVIPDDTDQAILVEHEKARDFDPKANRELKQFTVGPVPEGSVDWYLARVRIKNYFIDLRHSRKNETVTQWLTMPRPFRMIGSYYNAQAEKNYFIPTKLTPEFDGLVFFNQSTRAHPILQ
jgi:hypothetical protein